MLDEKVQEQLVERIAGRIEELNIFILKKMGESIKEIGSLTPSQAQELSHILKYGGNYEKIVNKIQEITKLNKKEIRKIFEEYAKIDYDFAEQFYNYRGIKYIPYDENNALKKQVEALAKIVVDDWDNLARTNMLGFEMLDAFGKPYASSLRQVYNNLVDQAILSVGQGKESFDEALFRQLKTIGSGGLKVIYPKTYIGKDGEEHHITRRLDSVMRMNMLDGLKNLHNELQQQFGKEFDSDGVEISVHSNPAPDHALVQGRQFSNEEFEKFQKGKDATSYDGLFFPAISEETGHDRRSISEYNCYHYIFSIVLGVSKPNYTNEQLQEINHENEKGFEFDGKKYTIYQGTQLQRKLETAIRREKDNQILAKASDNKKGILKSQENITNLTAKYNELCQISGLPRKADRLRVIGYKRVAKSKLK